VNHPKINDFLDSYTVPEMVALLEGHTAEEIAAALCWQHARAAYAKKREAEKSERHLQELQSILERNQQARAWLRECELEQRKGKKLIRLERMGST
jgi:hypothetical protein